MTSFINIRRDAPEMVAFIRPEAGLEDATTSDSARRPAASERPTVPSSGSVKTAEAIVP